MFRRRPFARPLPGIPRAREAFELEIASAHSFFDQGNFLEAGRTFEKLAEIAAARHGPRTPRFYLQAGRSFLHAGLIDRGMMLLERARILLIQTNRLDVLARAGRQLVAELQQMNLADQARTVAGWIAGLPMPAASHALDGKVPLLPLKCPSCGGPISADDVNWLDAHTAECDYCGSPLRPE